MYYIVEFESKDVEIVPSNWFEDGETLDVGESSFLAFPPKELPLRSLIRQNILPHSTWPTYTVTILYGHESLQKVRSKCQSFMNKENFQSTDLDAGRVKLPVNRFIHEDFTGPKKRARITEYKENLQFPEPDINVASQISTPISSMTDQGSSFNIASSVPYPSPLSQNNLTRVRKSALPSTSISKFLSLQTSTCIPSGSDPHSSPSTSSRLTNASSIIVKSSLIPPCHSKILSVQTPCCIENPATPVAEHTSLHGTSSRTTLTEPESPVCTKHCKHVQEWFQILYMKMLELEARPTSLTCTSCGEKELSADLPLPSKSVDELVAFTASLKDPKILSAFKKYLASYVEHHSVRKTVRNILLSIAHEHVLQLYSGTGRKGKLSFSNLGINGIIEEVVGKYHKEKKKEVYSIVLDELKRCPIRIGRREQKCVKMTQKYKRRLIVDDDDNIC